MKRLLVLVILLALLAAVMVGCSSGNDSAEPAQPREGMVGEADAAACTANRRLIDSAIQQYYGMEEVYPTSLQQLVPGYLESIPSCPGGGTYTLTGTRVICSLHGS